MAGTFSKFITAVCPATTMRRRSRGSPRYVVLEFEYNEDADSFVKDMQHDGESVVGVYAKPTQFCPTGGCGTGRIKGFVRGIKYGWWVCDNCRRPSRVHDREALMKHVISQATNLLPGASGAVASVWTRGWGAMSRG